MKIAENKSVKRQEHNIFSGFFSFLRSNDLLITDIIPYKRITKEGYLIDKYDEYQAYLKVRTTDLVSMNNSDLNRMISQLTSLCRVYTEPIKIISMTYSTETAKQQNYWKGRVNKYRRYLVSNNISYEEKNRYEVMLKLALDNLRRVTWVEDSLSELTFFIVAYGNNKKDMDTHVRDLFRLGGKQLDLQLVDRKNLESILFKLNNMNTEI